MNENVDYYGYTKWSLLSGVSLRARKDMFSLFMDTMAPGPSSRVLDVGANCDNDRQESNFFEKFYPYKDRITAASIEDAGALEDIYKGLKFVRLKEGEGLPFADDEFDITFSNAVVEHVGSRERQRDFVRDVVRVGKKSFISVPYRYFPVEHHTGLPFIHWLPQDLHRNILRLIGRDLYATEGRLNLISKEDFRGFFPPDIRLSLRSVKVFIFPSNLVAVVEKGQPHAK